MTTTGTACDDSSSLFPLYPSMIMVNKDMRAIFQHDNKFSGVRSIDTAKYVQLSAFA
jgi:hypothetical protein